MWDRFIFLLNRLDERLWVRPLIFCILSVGAAFVAKAFDGFHFFGEAPSITPESVETLLSITASSMLVIATLAVASMVSAYASGSSNATPRSFALMVADGTSQNALSTFLGTFIFTFVALIALKNDFYQENGIFVLFVMTLVVLSMVIVTFVRWVDWIARLGRIGTTIDQVEAAGLYALNRRRLEPCLGGAASDLDADQGEPVYAGRVGYVQHINLEALQDCASENDFKVSVLALPGTFVAPGRPLARLLSGDTEKLEEQREIIVSAFEIGPHRTYDDDPRFALIALSEIAIRALSPAVNDPGTAIGILGTYVRMFSALAEPLKEDEAVETRFDRVFVPELSAQDMMDDAFRAISRDGAGIVELQVWLQKALKTIACLKHTELKTAAINHSRAAARRAQSAMTYEQDVDTVLAAARWSSE